MYLQPIPELRKQTADLPSTKLNAKGKPEQIMEDGPNGKRAGRTLLQDWEAAFGDAGLIGDGMPLDSDNPQRSKMLQRNLWSVYKATHTVQSLLIMGSNLLYQFRSPLHGGGSGETSDLYRSH